MIENEWKCLWDEGQQRAEYFWVFDVGKVLLDKDANYRPTYLPLYIQQEYCFLRIPSFTELCFYRMPLARCDETVFPTFSRNWK